MVFFSHSLQIGTSDIIGIINPRKGFLSGFLNLDWLENAWIFSLGVILRIDGRLYMWRPILLSLGHSIDLISADYDRTTCILFLDYWQPDDNYFCILVFCSLVRLKTWVTWQLSNSIIEHPWRRKYLTFLLTHCTPFDLWALISEVHINRCLFQLK